MQIFPDPFHLNSNTWKAYTVDIVKKSGKKKKANWSVNLFPVGTNFLGHEHFYYTIQEAEGVHYICYKDTTYLYTCSK